MTGLERKCDFSLCSKSSKNDPENKDMIFS